MQFWVNFAMRRRVATLLLCLDSQNVQAAIVSAFPIPVSKPDRPFSAQSGRSIYRRLVP
jgi:hypothetical protein